MCHKDIYKLWYFLSGRGSGAKTPPPPQQTWIAINDSTRESLETSKQRHTIIIYLGISHNSSVGNRSVFLVSNKK